MAKKAHAFRLNEAVRRNKERFSDDFRFRIAAEGVANLKSQIATSSSDSDRILRSQFAILEGVEKGSAATSGRGIALMRTTPGPEVPVLPFFAALPESVDFLQPLLDAPEAGDEPKPKIGFHRGNR